MADKSEKMFKAPIKGNPKRPALVKADNKIKKAESQLYKAQSPKNKDPKKFEKGDKATKKKDKAIKTYEKLHGERPAFGSQKKDRY